MQLMRSIHKATVTTLTLPPHHSTNGYLIGGDGEAVLIDPKNEIINLKTFLSSIE